MVGDILTIVSPVLAISGIGFLWARFGPPFNTELVTSLVFSIGTPCLVFSTLTRFRLEPSLVADMALAAAASLACFAALGMVALRIAGLSFRAFLPSLMFSNAGNMGLPLCLFTFGDVGLALGIAYFTVASLANFTIGLWIVTGATSLRRLATTPLVHAAALGAGFLALGIEPPLWIANTTRLIGDFTIPAILLALGVALARLKVAALGRAAFVSALRLGGGFAVGVGLATLFGLDGAARGVLILDCAMPVAVYNYLFAERFGTAPADVAGAVVVSTVISFATLPLLIAFVL